MQRRWNFYHGGVILCIYMDLMALGMILFFLLYPYITCSHLAVNLSPRPQATLRDIIHPQRTTTFLSSGDSMLKGFRDFILRGNVMDLAVAVIIGAAFTAIVNSVVKDIINPLHRCLHRQAELRLPRPARQRREHHLRHLPQRRHHLSS